jgi:para-aminobenzoate synthetase component 1
MNGNSNIFKPKTIITHTIHFNQLLLLKENALQWAFSLSTCCYLNSNEYDLDAYHQYEGILGVGIQDSVSVSGRESLKSWAAFRARHPNTYQFGYFGYDLKNAIEPTLSSYLPDYVGLEDLYFFVPETVIQFYKDRCLYLA